MPPVSHSRLSAASDARLRLTFEVWSQIQETIGSTLPEQGGMLGGYAGEDVVRFFHFDQTAQRSYGAYSPDHRALNSLLKDEWNPKGIRLFGFVHSHPGDLGEPSYGDLLYAQAILDAIPELPRLLLPIVLPDRLRGAFTLHGYAAVRIDGAPHEDRVLQMSARELSVRIVPLVTSILVPPRAKSQPSEPVELPAEEVSCEPGAAVESPVAGSDRQSRPTRGQSSTKQGARQRGPAASRASIKRPGMRGPSKHHGKHHGKPQGKARGKQQRTHEPRGPRVP